MASVRAIFLCVLVLALGGETGHRCFGGGDETQGFARMSIEPTTELYP